MRRPHALERERLAVMLREATQTRDAREAIQRVIEKAFDSSNSADRLRLEIIQRCDIGGETTRAAAAALHLSLRQFFRHRSDAIQAIALSAEKVLRHPPDSQSHLLLLAQTIEAIDPKAALDIYLRAPLGCGGQLAYSIVRTSVWAGVDVTQDQIDACEGPWRLLALAAVARHLVARGDNERATAMRNELRAQLASAKGARYDVAAFELAFLDRLDARRRANTAESRALLARMRALAGQNEILLALTMVTEAEQAMIEGDLTSAAIALDDVKLLEVRNRDLNIMARAALGKAMLSHVRGFHQEAYALANGAGPALAALESGFALRAAGIAGRAALFCGAQWSPPVHLCEKYPNVWTRSHIEAVIARNLLPTNLSASQDAEFALALALRHESPILASYAQASLAAAFDVQGQAEKAQELRISAWETALRHDDEFALYDLFFNPGAPEHDLGPMKLDDQFASAVQRYLEERVPAYAAVHAGGLGSSSLAVVHYCLRAAAGKSDPQTIIAEHTRTLATGLLRKRTSAQQMHRFTGSAGRLAAHAVSCCVPPQQRPQFEERFARAWNEASDEIASLMEGDLARAV